MKSSIFSFDKLALASAVAAAAAWAAGCAQPDAPEREESVGEQQGAIGGTPCTAFVQGKPNPNWPQCTSGDGPTLPGQDCSGYPICYCLCRVDHQCGASAAECDLLGQCLHNCDTVSPGCPYPGAGEAPHTVSDCMLFSPTRPRGRRSRSPPAGAREAGRLREPASKAAAQGGA